MSSEALKFVKSNKNKGLSPSDKLILAAIAFLIADGQMACFASRKDIGREADVSFDTVKRSLLRLISANVIRRSARRLEDGRSDISKIEIVGFVDAQARVQLAPHGGQEAPRNGCSAHPGTGANCTPLYKEEQKRTEETEEKEEIRVADAREESLELGLSKTSSPDPIEAFNAYNRTAQEIGLPVAGSLTPGRRKSIGARLRDHGAESWSAVLANVRASAFLQGRNDRGWRPNLDWIIKPANYAKILEGNYTPSSPAPKPDRSNMVFQPSRWGPGKWVPKAAEAVQ